jgi:hypothetical protein
MSFGFDERGLLPAGCHEFRNWNTFASAFAFNPHRERLLSGLRKFIQDELATVGRGLDLVVGGSFLSNKPDPSDIDCTIAMPASLAAKRGELIKLSSDGDKGRIYAQYGVEFYLTLQVQGCPDFRNFFAYVGEKSAAERGLNAKDHRGTVKVKQWAKP